MLNATLVEKIHLTEELLILRIKPEGGIPDFKPGQYVALGLPDVDGKLVKRAYSIGSSPSTKDFLEFYVAVVPTGALSSKLISLSEGDKIHCAPKIVGTFTLHDIPEDNNLVLISTGTGLAPFMSMLRTPSTWTPNRKITVLHGVRKIVDLGYREELLELKKDPRLTYIPFVSREDAQHDIRRGYVQSVLESDEITLDPNKDNVFVCGNPAMIEDVEKLLTQKGYIVHSKKHPGTLHLEKYW